MSQGSTVVANGSGSAVRTALNAALAALLTNNSGASAPSSPSAYQYWADTTTGMLKQRNSANDNWITIGPMSDLGIQSGVQTYSDAGGTANAITGSFTPAITTVTDGMILAVRAGFANTTTTPTFTPASGTITARTIVKGTGVALLAGDIAGDGHYILLQYDASATKWVLLNPAKGVASGGLLGAAWADYTSSRALGSSYTNTKTYPISIHVVATPSAANLRLVITVGGIDLVSSAQPSSGEMIALNTIVPAGATYSAALSGAGTLTYWRELQ